MFIAWRRHVVGIKSIIISEVFAERCNFIAMSGYCHDMLSVCLSSSSSVTRVYCDKTIELRITQFSRKNSIRY